MKIEEVSVLLNLYRERTTTIIIFLIASSKVEFCHFTRLKKFGVQGSHQRIDVKFLFDRFIAKDGFDKYFKDFSFSYKTTQEHKRLWVMHLSCLGFICFQEKIRILV